MKHFCQAKHYSSFKVVNCNAKPNLIRKFRMLIKRKLVHEIKYRRTRHQIKQL